MRKKRQKKLSVHRETVRHLTPEHLEEARAAAAKVTACSESPNCDCGSGSTLSCTQ